MAENGNTNKCYAIADCADIKNANKTVDLFIKELFEANDIEDYKKEELREIVMMIKKIASDNNAGILCEFNSPFDNMACVSIIGTDIDIKRSNIRPFVKLSEISSNLEAYPKTDGTICITFTIHDLKNN